jgi:hypothetical protein
MPKRKASEDLPYEVTQLWCIRGGPSDTPIVLPIERVDGRDCVGLGAYSTWVNQALVGRNRCEDTAIHVNAFVSEALALLDPSPGESQSSGSRSDLPTPTKGRAALGIAEDSDEEIAALGGAALETAAKAAGSMRVAKSFQWTTIEMRGIEITVRRRHRARAILIPVDGDDIAQVLQVLRAALLGKQTYDTQWKRQRQVHRTPVEGQDLGRVRWHFKYNAWQVMYQDAKGNLKSCTRGLVVPTVDFTGSPLPPEKYEALRLDYLNKARTLWNSLDASETVRYPERLGL